MSSGMAINGAFVAKATSVLPAASTLKRLPLTMVVASPAIRSRSFVSRTAAGSSARPGAMATILIRRRAERWGSNTRAGPFLPDSRSRMRSSATSTSLSSVRSGKPLRHPAPKFARQQMASQLRVTLNTWTGFTTGSGVEQQSFHRCCHTLGADRETGCAFLFFKAIAIGALRL